jgi:hypothetical protein
MTTKTVPELATIEGMLDEVEEYARELAASRRKLKQHRTGSARAFRATRRFEAKSQTCVAGARPLPGLASGG